MLLKALVDMTEQVAATRSRNAKTTLVARVLTDLVPEELPAAIGMLLGKPRQGRTGVGWRTLTGRPAGAAAEATLTITDVDAAISRLATLVGSGHGSNAARDRVIADLFERATPGEQDFLTRVLLGDVRTGALAGVITDAVAEAFGIPKDVVRRAAMLSGDLGKTAALARAGGDLTAVGLQPGVPVMPMLAGTAPTATAALESTGESSIEFKLDGARLQVHRVDGAVTAYTRSLADITTRVPEVAALVATFPGGDLILDGETLTLDADGKARPFAETMSRFGSLAGESQLSVWFFDVLYAEGGDLIDEPLRTRREVLRRIVGDRTIPGRESNDPEMAEQVMADAIGSGHEGVVVKSLDAPYAAGRRGSQWIKVKPVHTFDLVVLGVEWGYGRRTGWLSNLHLGARDPDGKFGEPGGFVMVGKTFKGLTDETLRWQTEYFPTIATNQTDTAVFLEPSTVVEIAIDGVQRSTRYLGGVALRFARVKRYRVDEHAKPADEADTIDRLRAMLAVPETGHAPRPDTGD